MTCSEKENRSRTVTPSSIAAFTNTHAGATNDNTDRGSVVPVIAIRPLAIQAIIMSYAHGQVISFPPAHVSEYRTGTC
jgi:hypothetical protein